MNMRMVKLRFLGPVHFGRGRLSDSHLACDAATLFSALYIEALKLGVQDALLEAARTGELLLSDAFPYAGNTLYLPKPMVQINPAVAVSQNPDDENSRARKAAKKLDYIPTDELDAFLNGSFDPIKALAEFHVGVSGVQTKVNLQREDTPEALPYHVGGFLFAPGAGLYFLTEGSFDIAPILDQLAFAGLGGKRTSGYGRFEYEISDYRLATGLIPDSNGRHMLLATAAPTTGELSDSLLQDARYRLVKRGGFVQSVTHSDTTQKKQELYAFAAGSVFSREFMGDVFDVNATTDAHPVYRYARAMWLEV